MDIEIKCENAEIVTHRPPYDTTIKLKAVNAWELLDKIPNKVIADYLNDQGWCVQTHGWGEDEHDANANIA